MDWVWCEVRRRPRGLALSPGEDKLYVSEMGLIRCIWLNDRMQVVTIAGSGRGEEDEDEDDASVDGVGEEATFRHPAGLAISSDGDTLYVADRWRQTTFVGLL